MYSADEDDVDNNVEVIHDNLNNSEGADQSEAIAGQPGIEGQNGDNEGDNENDEDTAKKVKPKRVVRNPQPKLDAQALKGPKGLLCVEGYFKNKKFKGRGHEEQDLKMILKTYEYWCHRLFPKYPFEECLAKIESLGTKRPMQTYLKRIRMDLIFDEEKPIDNDDEDEDDQPMEGVSSEFDALVQQEREGNNDSATQLNEDQLERIRLNKEKADRLRKERLQKAKDRAKALTNESRLLDRIPLTDESSQVTENSEIQAESNFGGESSQVTEHSEIQAESNFGGESSHVTENSEIQAERNFGGANSYSDKVTRYENKPGETEVSDSESNKSITENVYTIKLVDNIEAHSNRSKHIEDVDGLSEDAIEFRTTLPIEMEIIGEQQTNNAVSASNEKNDNCTSKETGLFTEDASHCTLQSCNTDEQHINSGFVDNEKSNDCLPDVKLSSISKNDVTFCTETEVAIKKHNFDSTLAITENLRDKVIDTERNLVTDSAPKENDATIQMDCE